MRVGSLLYDVKVANNPWVEGKMAEQSLRWLESGIFPFS